MVRLSASILAADFAHLARDVRAAEVGGASMIHCDVMDGAFVPNLTIGPDVVAAIGRNTALPLDVHLMIESPDRHLQAFADAGAAWITVHVETCKHLHRTLDRIRELGARPGVAINPHTPWRMVEEVLEDLDLLLIMSVNPGFGGQRFIRRSLRKIRAVARARRCRGLAFQIEVDGGIGVGNVGEVVAAGADVVVAGSAVFGEGDPVSAARRLLDAARDARPMEEPGAAPERRGGAGRGRGVID